MRLVLAAVVSVIVNTAVITFVSLSADPDAWWWFIVYIATAATVFWLSVGILGSRRS